MKQEKEKYLLWQGYICRYLANTDSSIQNNNEENGYNKYVVQQGWIPLKGEGESFGDFILVCDAVSLLKYCNQPWQTVPWKVNVK